MFLLLRQVSTRRHCHRSSFKLTDRSTALTPLLCPLLYYFSFIFPSLPLSLPTSPSFMTILNFYLKNWIFFLSFYIFILLVFLVFSLLPFVSVSLSFHYSDLILSVLLRLCFYFCSRLFLLHPIYIFIIFPFSIFYFRVVFLQLNILCFHCFSLSFFIWSYIKDSFLTKYLKLSVVIYDMCG